MIFILGGARSGKSRLAQERLLRFERVAYIATAQVLDEEMRQRVALHRESRPQHWATIEEPLDLCAAVDRALSQRPQAILLDCLTLWLSNRMLQVWETGWTLGKEGAVLEELDKSVKILLNAECEEALIVSNEVGFSLVPDNPMGRAFRDLAGRANQNVSSHCGEAYLAVAGLNVKLK